MKFIKEIFEGELIPAWYGLAWRKWQTNSTVCLPVPLNIVAALVRAIWIWAKHGARAVPINPRDAYAQGRKDGATK